MSLLQRIIFDKDEVPLSVGPVEAVKTPEVLEVPVAITTIQTGGKIKQNYMEYFQRWNLYLFIFFISVFLAIITINKTKISQKLLKNKSITDMSTDLGDEQERWKRMVNYTIVFICIVLMYNLALMFGAYIWIHIGKMFTSNPKPALDIWETIFWKYKNPFDEVIEIGKTYMITLIMVLFVVFTCYIGFSKWFPDWFDSMYFQSTPKKKQDTQPQDYIYYYAIFLIGMMLFLVIILDIKMLGDNKMYMFYNIAFFIAYMILVLFILREYKNGKPKKLGLTAILVFLMFFTYPILLSLIKMEKKGSDIFNAKFLSNIMFHFAIPE